MNLGHLQTCCHCRLQLQHRLQVIHPGPARLTVIADALVVQYHCGVRDMACSRTACSTRMEGGEGDTLVDPAQDSMDSMEVARDALVPTLGVAMVEVMLTIEMEVRTTVTRRPNGRLPQELHLRLAGQQS